jgi:hypothetical protein
MSAQLEKRIATFVAITLAGLVPVLATAGYTLASGICGAIATGLSAAYYVRTAEDRRAPQAEEPSAPKADG